MKGLVLRPQAEAEALTAAEWYRARSQVVAVRFVDELEKTLARVLAEPLAFPAVEGNARRARVRGFPYSVYFQVHGETAIVLAIFHGRRNPAVRKARSGSGTGA